MMMKVRCNSLMSLHPGFLVKCIHSRRISTASKGSLPLTSQVSQLVSSFQKSSSPFDNLRDKHILDKYVLMVFNTITQTVKGLNSCGDSS